MNTNQLDTLDATAIIEQMTADGWMFTATNHAMQNGKMLMRRGQGYICLFGKREQIYQRSDVTSGVEFTEVVRAAARKALARGW